MPQITCFNEECGEDIDFDFSMLEVDESEESGEHTTQHSGSGEIMCRECGEINFVSCVWDELNDTGEILSFDLT